MTQVGRVELVSLGMRPPVHVDLAPDVRGAFEDHDDPLLLRKLDDLHRIRRRHQARTAGRETVAFGIVLRLVLRVVVVHGRRPGLERHLRLRFRAASAAAAGRPLAATERSVAPCRGWRAAAAARRRVLFHVRLPVFLDDALAHVRDVGDVPHTFFAGNPSEVRRAVRQAWCGLRRSGGAASAAAGCRLGAGLPGANAQKRGEQNRDHRAEQRATQVVPHVHVSLTQIDAPAERVSVEGFRSDSIRRTTACHSPPGRRRGRCPRRCRPSPDCLRPSPRRRP